MTRRFKTTWIVLLVFLLAVGFAAVTTNLYINNSASISTNPDDFDVFFFNAFSDYGTATISSDKKSISYSTTSLQSIGDYSELYFYVMNNSTLYDAKVNLRITDDSGNTLNNDYVSYRTYFYNADNIVKAGEMSGCTFGIKLKKTTIEDIQYNFNIVLDVEAIERDEVISNQAGFYDAEENLLMSYYDFQLLIDNHPEYQSYTTMSEFLTNIPGLSNTAKIVYPSSSNYKITITDSLFKDCSSLKQIILSDNVDEIGVSAFENCTSLETIDIPAETEKIYANAFKNTGLTTAYFQDPTGWKLDGEEVSSDILSDPEQAAEFLKNLTGTMTKE